MSGTNPFGVSTSRSSSPAVAAATTNPFGAPPPIPVRQFQTGPAAAPSSAMSPFVLSSSPAPVLTAATGSAVFISQDAPAAAAAASQFSVGSAAAAAAYPQAYNPFL